MSKLGFIREIWNRVEEFSYHLVSDVIMIILTILALWIIGCAIPFFFPSEPETVKLMKMISELSIILIAAIRMFDDVYRTAINTKVGERLG